MKIVTLFVMGMFLTSVVADDVDDAKAAELDLMEAENQGDMDRIFRHIAPGRSVFLPNGGLLILGGTPEDKRRRQAQSERGFKLNLRVRHLEAEVYGDTAVLTYYRVGTISAPDGTSRPVSLRVSVVRVKQAGQWKVVHRHGSTLTLP